MSVFDKPPPTRQRNKRGQGDLLRNDLVATAIAMVEEDQRLSLRSIARRVGIATTSIYLHFPDLDHLLAAVVDRSFTELTNVAAAAGEGATDPADELRRRCRAYCHFGLDHPRLYKLMFEADLPQATLADDPDDTPGRRAFRGLLAAVSRCLEAGLAPAYDDPVRLDSFIWAAEHGIVVGNIDRPTFPWPPIDRYVDEMVDRLMGFGQPRRRR